MNQTEYIVKRVKILDAQVEQEEDKNLPFSQSLVLLIQDIEEGSVFKTILSEDDVKAITNTKGLNWTSKDLIDFAIALRNREAPVSMMIPRGSVEISTNDFFKSRSLDQPNKKKRRRYRGKKNTQKSSQTRNNN